jgi:hypothetical protein
MFSRPVAREKGASAKEKNKQCFKSNVNVK